MKKLIPFICLVCYFSLSQTVIAQDSAAVTEEVPFDYLNRSPIYDYDVNTLSNVDTIPSFESQNNKLKISGTIYQSDGITPANNIILFIWQQNEDGYFDMKIKDDKRYVYNRGWIKTDADGKYTFFTFVPGSYPHSREKRIIHAEVKEAGIPEYALNALLFNDDPFLTKACRKKLEKKGINNILTTLKKDDIYVASYDIVLPEKTPISE
jgi:protocatechuate 3,4-dioxygenase beta subunit